MCAKHVEYTLLDNCVMRLLSSIWSVTKAKTHKQIPKQGRLFANSHPFSQVGFVKSECRIELAAYCRLCKGISRRHNAMVANH